jgi:hypothetical protein
LQSQEPLYTGEENHLQAKTTSRVKLIQQMADSITSDLNDKNNAHTETLVTIRNKWEAASLFTAFSVGAADNAAK